MVVGKSLLNRVQFVVLCQALHGQHLALVCLDSEDRARLDAGTIQQDSAGPAIGGVAAHVRTGQIEFLPQQVHQQKPGFHFQ